MKRLLLISILVIATLSPIVWADEVSLAPWTCMDFLIAVRAVHAATMRRLLRLPQSVTSRSPNVGVSRAGSPARTLCTVRRSCFTDGGEIWSSWRSAILPDELRFVGSGLRASLRRREHMTSTLRTRLRATKLRMRRRSAKSGSAGRKLCVQRVRNATQNSTRCALSTWRRKNKSVSRRFSE